MTARHSVINRILNERINRVNHEGDSLTKLTWPDFYPEDCPPAEAEPASGTVYRLVRRNPAQAEDFKTPFEENPRRFNDKPTLENCGLSVHTDSQDSERLRERLKNRARKFKNRQIAEGSLDPTLGMIQHTPSIEGSHHSWWVPLGAEPWLVFNVIG